MNITQFIFELEKIKADHGDLPVYSIGEFGVEGEMTIKNKQLYFHVWNDDKQLFQLLPKRLSIGYWRETI